MGEYTIKDLEKLSGIKAHTIRIWEKRYGIIHPDRTDTNRRRYSDEELRKLINISILNRNGFKISRIASLSVSEIEDKVSFISQDLSQTDTQIESLIIAMINLDELAFNDIITRLIVNHGFEETYTDIVFPFLRRVGMLWVTGSITPAQEHFVSNLVRQKLIANIEAQIVRKTDRSRRIILFLPENELHELGLLFYAYLAKKNGHEVLYLGPQTPIDSVKRAIKIWPADILVTGTSSNISVKGSRDLINRLATDFKDQNTIITGRLIPDNGNKLPGNIFTADNPVSFIKLINSGI